MNTPITDEQRRKRIVTITQIAGLCGLGFIGFLISPYILSSLAGLAGLSVLLLTGLAAVNLGLPYLAINVANWRLKIIKSAAAANPIETLENQYAQRQEALLKIRDNIKEFYSVIQELWTQIQDHNQKFPNSPSQFLEKYNKMKALLELRSAKYKKAQANLVAFNELIEEKRSDWKIAQSAAKASKLANVGEDFQSKLMQDTALTTIQDGLNFAFSELEVSLLDEQPAAQVTTNSVTTTKVIDAQVLSKKAIANTSSAPALDLGFDSNEHEDEDVVVPVKKSNRNKN